MNYQFDELAKALSQSTTRRAALKKFGVGLAGMALAAFGVANNAKAIGGDDRWHMCQSCLKICKANGGTPQACHASCPC